MHDTIIGIEPMAFGEPNPTDELNESTVTFWLLNNKPVPLNFFDKTATDELMIINCVLDEHNQVITGIIVNQTNQKIGDFAVGIHQR